MKTNILFAAFIPAIALLTACGPAGKTPSTPTSGNIKIGVDESYEMLIKAQVQVFEADYTNALIKPVYANEADVFEMIFNDSIRTVIVNRKLTADEEKFLDGKKIVPKTTLIAKDGLAFVINKDNPENRIRYDQIRDIFTGKIKQWDQINKESELKNVEVIFDNNRSGNPRYIREKFNIQGKFPENCFAVNSNTEVISYVEKNPGAMGIISVNWISDKDDTVSNNFLKTTKVVGIGYEGDTIGDGVFVKPYQAYIFDGTYPFIREVYVINCESFSGLGTGFAAFLAGEKGQRIISKSGLVPATMPVRLIQIKK